jgi:hypothetical protein
MMTEREMWEGLTNIGKLKSELATLEKGEALKDGVHPYRLHNSGNCEFSMEFTWSEVEPLIAARRSFLEEAIRGWQSHLGIEIAEKS